MKCQEKIIKFITWFFVEVTILCQKINFYTVIKRKYIKAYLTIDELPIWNFDKVRTEKELRYLLRLKDYNKLPKTSLNLEEIWEDIYYQYLDEFGDSDISRQLSIAEINYWDIYWNLMDTNNRKLITKIHLKIKEIDRIKKLIDMNPQSLAKQIEIVERWRRLPIDPKKTSVLMWYTYVKAMEEEHGED